MYHARCRLPSRGKVMRRFLLAIGLSLLAASASASAAADWVVTAAWIPLLPPPARMQAGYATLRNDSASDLVIVAASSAEFASVSLHQSRIEDGVAQMSPLAAVTIPAHGSFRFEPGAAHLMLMGPKRAFASGDQVQIEFELQDGRRLPVAFTVGSRPTP
ncbi:MAG: hypothetical protein COS34_14060 [Lysobacterales bacterium CG02_land_8_20_14_3_00_62_12]|nr:MAG: hypothetical protein COS34_14060 [Xanthomonadales bacterium CG02_land_8_20_14_3_00_62_12]